MAEYQVARPRLRGWMNVLVGALLASCGETETPLSGSETHFLAPCFESCGDGFECLSGVCTQNCEKDADCNGLSDAAVCATATEGCRVLCDTDADCSKQNQDWVCDDGQCLSSQPPVDPPECPLFEGGVQDPTPASTPSVEVPGSENALEAVADDSGLFWRDDSGAVYGRVDSQSLELRPPLDETLSAMGMITDDTTLYFAEAGPPRMAPPDEPGPPPPPGRLYAVPKTGGTAELLLELDDALVTPLAATDRGVVILSDERLYLVADEGVELLDHIPPMPGSNQLQVVGGRVYWSDWSSVREPTELFATDLDGDGGEPEVVTEIDGTFLVGSGRVLWKTERIVQDPLVQVEELVMFDLETGCVTQLPSRGESMGMPLLDAHHVYWQSFNSLGNYENSCVERGPLIRVNLTTGALEELTVEGFDITLCTDFMTQDDDRLYLRNWPDRALVAIDKPE